VRVYRRYLQLEPTHAEEFIAYLKSKVRQGADRQGLTLPGCISHAVITGKSHSSLRSGFPAV
jgi:hypothetical protein